MSDVKTSEGTLTVRKSVWDNSKPGGALSFTEDKVETIEVVPFKTEPAKVSVGLSTTINMGNYESAKVDVFVSLPCYREEVESTYKAALSFVQAKVTQERAAIVAFKAKK